LDVDHRERLSCERLLAIFIELDNKTVSIPKISTVILTVGASFATKTAAPIRDSSYLASERQSEWSAYRAKLMQTHGRKYKLMGMLEQRDLA